MLALVKTYHFMIPTTQYELGEYSRAKFVLVLLLLPML